jgi:uncharacterized protein YheU (UPF0270 family)
VIKIPHTELSAQALAGVIDEFVMREGTDYGHRDFTLGEKRARVLTALQKGHAAITFDPDTQTTSIVTSESFTAPTDRST